MYIFASDLLNTKLINKNDQDILELVHYRKRDILKKIINNKEFRKYAEEYCNKKQIIF